VKEVDRHIVVIGGGQSAKGLLFVMAETLARGHHQLKSARVTIIEKGNEFGTGLAWSRQYALDEHLSSLAEPFSRVSYGEGQQRQLHGAVQLLNEFALPVTLLPQQEAVQIRRLPMDRLEVDLASGKTLRADYVILANGYWQPDDPLKDHRGYHSTPWPATALQDAVFERGHHISSARSKRILILGTYLNGIDAALSLAFRVGTFKTDREGRMQFAGPAGLKIILASRNGYLPKVWGRAPEPRPARWFTEDRLNELISIPESAGFLTLNDAFALLARELGDADPVGAKLFTSGNGDSPIAALRNGLQKLHRLLRSTSSSEILQRDIAAVTVSGRPWGTYADVKPCAWQSALFNALPQCSEYSHALSAQDQAFFDRHLRTLFFNYTMPTTIENAVRLEAMMRSGHLETLALGANYTYRPSRSGEALEVLFKDRFGHSRQLEFTDIINALGQCSDIRKHPSRLVQNLLRNGLIQPALRPFRDHEMGASEFTEGSLSQNTIVRGGRRYLATGGIYVNPRTCETIPPGQTETFYRGVERAKIFAMGPNVMGQFLDAQGIAHITRDAQRIVSVISHG
jgi:uncharacterized NAD(P)/FAD-binding protein YdhS